MRGTLTDSESLRVPLTTHRPTTREPQPLHPTIEAPSPSPNPDTKPPCGSGVLVKASFPP
ncbi:hypothetical protein GCM10009565_92770 [Amycolatopsis albidoflavus]